MEVPEISQNGMAIRPKTLDGAVIGLLANHKPNAESLLEAIYDALAEKFDLGRSIEVNKGDAVRLASPELLKKLASDVDVVITANGD